MAQKQIEYSGYIKNITTGLWIESEKSGQVTYTSKLEDRLIFHEEWEAVSLLEFLNDNLSDCFTLYENK